MFVLCCDVPPMDSARGAPRTGCHRAPLEVDCCYANFLNLLNSHVCRVFQSPGKPAEKQKNATLGGFFSSPCRGDRVFVQCVRRNWKQTCQGLSLFVCAGVLTISFFLETHPPCTLLESFRSLSDFQSLMVSISFRLLGVDE